MRPPSPRVNAPGPAPRLQHAPVLLLPVPGARRPPCRPPMRGHRVGSVPAAAPADRLAGTAPPARLMERIEAGPPSPVAHWSLPALVAVASALASPLAAAAADAIPYDKSAGSDFLKNVAGAAYVVLLVVFAARLLRKRATTATSQRFASAVKAQESLDAVRATPRPTVRATPARAAL